jgi:hypothetical protein
MFGQIRRAMAFRLFLLKIYMIALFRHLRMIYDSWMFYTESVELVNIRLMGKQKREFILQLLKFGYVITDRPIENLSGKAGESSLDATVRLMELNTKYLLQSDILDMLINLLSYKESLYCYGSSKTKIKLKIM